MIRISFNHLLPDPLIIMVFIAVIFVICWLYSKKAIRRWPLLFTLNGLSAVIILSLIFRPEISVKTVSGRRESLSVLVDTSLSMSISDGTDGATRLEAAKKFIKESPVLKKYKLSLYGFGDAPVKIEDEKQWEELKPLKNTSFIFDAITQVDREAGDDCKGILVFTDGQESRATDTDMLKTNFGKPVFTVGLGSFVPADAGITDVISNSPVYSGENVKIGVYLNQSSLDGRKAQLLLKDGGRVIQEKAIAFSGKTQTVDFDMPSPPSGEHVYQVEVDTGETDDRIPENNRMNLFVSVLLPKINILYVEGSLRWEYKFLKRYIESNANFSPVFLIRVGENLFNQTGGEGMKIPPDIFGDIRFLEKFDIIILGDINFSSFPSVHLKNLYDFVSTKGKSLLLLGGENLADGLKNTPVQEVIPFRVTGAEKNIISQPFLPAFTEEGKTLPVFGTDTGPFPQLDRANSVTDIKPGTVPILSAGGTRQSAVLVGINTTLSGKSAFIGTDNTWKWALGNEKEKKAYQVFWSGILRYMWTPEDYSGIGRVVPEIITDRKFYGTGEKISPQFTYRETTPPPSSSIPSPSPSKGGSSTMFPSPLRGEGPGGGDNFTASLTTPDGKSVPLEVQSGKTSFTAEKEGLYTIRVTAGGRKNTREIFVSRDGAEFRDTERNEIFLKHIAEFQSGGRYIPFENIGELENILKKKKTFKTRNLSVTQNSFKYLIPLVFILLNTGWYIRRRSGIL